jgi:hypothetical protein
MVSEEQEPWNLLNCPTLKWPSARAQATFGRALVKTGHLHGDNDLTEQGWEHIRVANLPSEH